jgi:agmatine deiminase
MYPQDLGFRMPAEWTSHQRTFMEWPIKEALWPEQFDEVLSAVADVAKKISRFEPVTMIVKPDLLKQAKTLLSGSSIQFIEIEHDDSWMRDNGPTFIINGKREIAGINWLFNAWGDKYPCSRDNLIAAKILDGFGITRFDAKIVMEGGSIHVDGEGTLLTTEECLLNKNRNPGFSRAEIEDTVKKYLNVSKIIWLKTGLFGDDTDGHIDNVACFAAPGKIIIQVCSDKNDPNYILSQNNLNTLKKETDALGRKFEIIKIEQPPAIFLEDTRLTLSYLNFYFVNGGIILPIFGGKCSETDELARKTLQSVFPKREIVTVNSLPITWGGGNIHCITQQMPKV